MYGNEHQKSTPINSKHSPMKLVPILTWQKYFAFVWRISSNCSRAHRVWYFRLTKNRWEFFTFVKINALEHEQIFTPPLTKHPLYHQNKRFHFLLLLTKWLMKLNLKVAGKGKLNRLFVKDCLIIINISGLSTPRQFEIAFALFPHKHQINFMFSHTWNIRSS